MGQVNYKDSYGRLHHKPVTSANPIPSNNSWLYTAYAEKAGVPVDKHELDSCFNECVIPMREYNIILRSPGQYSPPTSRDEIIGAVSLGCLNSDVLNSWSFSPLPLPKFSLLKLIKQLWELRPSLERVNTWQTLEHSDEENDYVYEWKVLWPHRNYFWQNNLDQIYRFAFLVPIQDRNFILQKWGKKNYFYAAIAYVDSKLGKASGIHWLKYGGEKNKAEMVKEFPQDHPIRLAK